MSENRRAGGQTQSLVPLTKGTEVGHYKTISEIGSVGTGKVYLAQDSQLGRKVALKFLPPHLCKDEDCRARFKREAKAAAKLHHSDIVQAFVITSFMPVWWLGCYAVISRPIGVMKMPHNHCYVQMPFTS
jgi:serine/threonine protein kinase